MSQKELQSEGTLAGSLQEPKKLLVRVRVKLKYQAGPEYVKPAYDQVGVKVVFIRGQLENDAEAGSSSPHYPFGVCVSLLGLP